MDTRLAKRNHNIQQWKNIIQDRNNTNLTVDEYCKQNRLNQEQYLKTFLTEPEVPLDNNDAERSIKKLCIGKHSWHIIESKNGAKASAMMYSIAETSKANGLNPFEYFQYLMEQLKEYPRNNVPEDKLAELMPWSETLPDYCKQLKR